MKAYTGSCHCQAVEFSLQADDSKPSTISDCNCSICAVKGLKHFFTTDKDFVIKKGQDQLTLYTFNKKIFRHYFCKVCGVPIYVEMDNPDGSKGIAVHASTIHDFDMSKCATQTFDGKSL